VDPDPTQHLGPADPDPETDRIFIDNFNKNVKLKYTFFNQISKHCPLQNNENHGTYDADEKEKM
jgi:hypothetical protein